MLHLYNLIYNPIIYNDVECLTLWGSFHDQLGGGGGGGKQVLNWMRGMWELFVVCWNLVYKSKTILNF